MRRLRVYVDTSVLGGCFDEGFAEAYNQVNLASGYGVLTIVTPKELTFYEHDEG